MKKILTILAVCLVTWISQAQIVYINLTSLATNLTTSSAYITIPGICTNYQYTVVNSNNIVVGDPIPSAFGKVNSDFAYVSNELVLLAQLPNQINSSLATGIASQSNRINAVILTNSWLASDITSWGAFSGGTSNQLWNFFATNNPSGNSGETSNLLVDFLPSDEADPPSSYGIQWLSQDTGHVLFEAHNYSGGYEIPCEDFFTWGATFHSESFIDGPTSTRWGYLNVDEDGGVFHFDFEPDNYKSLYVQYDGLLTANQLGVANDDPYYTIDCGGDINYAGTLYNNGVAIGVPQPDSAGFGGTTLLLNASDTGTPMYIHIDSSGTITATTSP